MPVENKCPYCYRYNLKNSYLDGILQNSYDLVASAAVLKCPNCHKDYFSETIAGSLNYKIEDTEEKTAAEELERLKTTFGYVDNK